MGLTLFYISFLIVLLFFALLFIKQIFPKRLRDKFCVICATISISWMALFVLYKLGWYQDKLLIGILMGQTIVGLYYFLISKLKDRLRIFSLPFILTSTFLFYFLLGNTLTFSVVLLIFVVWIFTSLLYSYKENSKIKGFVDKLVECCKRW